MGLLEWLGLGGRSGPPTPLVLIAGVSGSGRKTLINRLLDGLDPAEQVCVILYDQHHAEEAIRQRPGVCVHAHVHHAIKCRCHGEGSLPLRKSVAAARREGPAVIVVQVGRERGAVEVLADLRRLEGRVKLAGMTAVLNAESALNDLRDAEDDPASYVRAAGQALITHLDTAPSWSAEALRRRVAELQPKAVVVEDQALAAENIRGQIARVRAEQAVA